MPRRAWSHAVDYPSLKMLNPTCALVLCLLLSAASAAETVPALRKELLDRKADDQAVRQELIAKGWAEPDPVIEQRMLAQNAENSERIRAIVRQYGWPTAALVGRDGVEAAFLLVQHGDLSLQQQMLPFVEQAFRNRELPGESYALLFDRVRVREGKPQVYGTQAKPAKEWQNGEPALQPIEDEANVDQRRAELGMPPLQDYIAVLKRVYSSR